MNLDQRKILYRLGVFAALLLFVYILVASYIRQNYSNIHVFQLVILISGIYVIILSLLWIRERNLYHDYIMGKRIKTGNSHYIMCPNCRVIQPKGDDSCIQCKEEWILCKACFVPFEKGSAVLIAPCCGEGFHRDHFEAALRENSKCPYCNSEQALIETNW